MLSHGIRVAGLLRPQEAGWRTSDRISCAIHAAFVLRAATSSFQSHGDRLSTSGDAPLFRATSTIAGVQRKGHIFWNQGFSSLFYVLHASYVCDMMSLQEQSCGVPSQHVL